MARPYWSGNISISLVSFPVKLFVATEAKNEIRFHQIDRASGERVRHQKVRASAVEMPNEEPADTVQQSEIVKGYEYAKGQYVTIEPEELASLRVPSKHTMEITQFVKESEIDPEFYEKPYFITPDSDAAAEAFLTVRAAMVQSGRVGLTKIAFGGREHIVAIAPAGSDEHPGMMAYTMRYAAELRKADEYFRDIKPVKVEADSLGLAKELISRKSAAFDPSQFADGYEDAVKQLVEAKLQHAPVPKDEVATPQRGKVVNLMDALRKSIGTGGSSETADDREAEPAKKSKAKPAAHKPEKAGPQLVKPVAAKRIAKPAQKPASARRKSA